MTTEGTILVIDDSAMVRRHVCDAVQRLGFEAAAAGDGAEALALLASRRVVLVITDFVMPSMSGIELIEAIRRNAASHELPVIVLSAVTDGGLVQQGFALGVKAWLKKPFKAEVLTAAVASILSPPTASDSTGPCAS